MINASLSEWDDFLARFRTSAGRLRQEYDEVDEVMKQLAVAMEDTRQEELFMKWNLTAERFDRLFDEMVPSKKQTL